MVLFDLGSRLTVPTSIMLALPSKRARVSQEHQLFSLHSQCTNIKDQSD